MEPNKPWSKLIEIVGLISIIAIWGMACGYMYHTVGYWIIPVFLVGLFLGYAAYRALNE